LAKSARESARSAQAAAEYAAQSVAATVAGIKVTFHASPRYLFDGIDAQSLGVQSLGVTLACTGATVFVHEARILEAMHSVRQAKDHEVHGQLIWEDDGHSLATETKLPLRMHNGETVAFRTTPEFVLEEDVSVSLLRVQVKYSLDSLGEGIVREVVWYGAHGHDY
jgi:hypothetical protein